MTARVPGKLRLPHVDHLHPDLATFMMARTVAEVYRDVLDEPVPEPLVVVLRQMERWVDDHERQTV
jgi:hypothetical protein